MSSRTLSSSTPSPLDPGAWKIREYADGTVTPVTIQSGRQVSWNAVHDEATGVYRLIAGSAPVSPGTIRDPETPEERHLIDERRGMLQAFADERRGATPDA